MAKYRKSLPQLGEKVFLTDGGLETTLVFLEGIELPYFAAFHLLATPGGNDALRKYFRTYARLARRFDTGIILETATWRANRDWAAKLGYAVETLAQSNRRSVDILKDIREEFENDSAPIVISGCIGPRGDGYVPDQIMSANKAREYHQAQVSVFADTAADLITAITMNYAEEAIGIAQAAKDVGMPAVISFTVETDGKFVTGQSLKDAITQVDDETSGYPAYYMINCSHPTHFDSIFTAGERWTGRIRGVRANASTMSHAELDESPELDSGNPAELAKQLIDLRGLKLPNLNIFGGCCGTDDRHIEQMGSRLTHPTNLDGT